MSSSKIDTGIGRVRSFCPYDMCCKNRDRSEATSHSNCGCVEGHYVAPTTEHNRFSIVWVFQASDDIQLPYTCS